MEVGCVAWRPAPCGRSSPPLPAPAGALALAPAAQQRPPPGLRPQHHFSHSLSYRCRTEDIVRETYGRSHKKKAYGGACGRSHGRSAGDRAGDRSGEGAREPRACRSLCGFQSLS